MPCLQREAAARKAHVGEGRIRAARLQARLDSLIIVREQLILFHLSITEFQHSKITASSRH